VSHTASEQVAWCLARQCRADDVLVVGVATPMIHPEEVSRSAVGVYSQAQILDVIQRGRITLQFISPAQVDGRGALNTSRVRGKDGSLVRLPGGLATADIARLMGRLVVYRVGHERRFLTEQVDFVTGAPGRVAAIVTSAAVIEWDGERFRLASVHEGSTVDEVVAGCGFALDLPARVPTTEPPPPEALRLLREEIDRHGLLALETRDGRAGALRTLEALS